MSLLSKTFSKLSGGLSLTQGILAGGAAALGQPTLAASIVASGIGANGTTGAAILPGESSTGNSTGAGDPLSGILENLKRVFLQGGNVPGLPANVVTGTAPAAGGGGMVARIAGLGAGLLVVGNLIKTGAGKIVGILLPSGEKMSAAAVYKLAKEIGFGAAVTALGIGATDLAQIIFHHEKKKHHRGRGITAAQLRITGRTIGKVERAHRRIAQLAAHAVHHRRAAPRPIVVTTKR